MAKLEVMDGPLDDAVSFTMEAGPGRDSEDGGMGWWSLALWGAAVEPSASAAPLPPTHTQRSPPTPQHTPRGRHQEHGGQLLQADQPQPPPRRPPPTKLTLNNGANLAVSIPTTLPQRPHQPSTPPGTTGSMTPRNSSGRQRADLGAGLVSSFAHMEASSPRRAARWLARSLARENGGAGLVSRAV